MVLVLQVDHRWLGVVGLAVADDDAQATAARRPAAPRGRRQLSRWLLTAYGALSLGSCLQLYMWAAVLFAMAPARQHGRLVVRCGHADELWRLASSWRARRAETCTPKSPHPLAISGANRIAAFESTICPY